ncbi:MAG: hypothetical protein WC379_12975 [Methanoregula sp.]
MNKNYLTLLWKCIGGIAFIVACIDFSWVMVYNRNYFHNTGLIMIVLLIAIFVIRYYSEK